MSYDEWHLYNRFVCSSSKQNQGISLYSPHMGLSGEDTKDIIKFDYPESIA